VIEDGRSGILIGVEDTVGLEKALAQVLSDNNVRMKLGTSAAERAKQFSITKTVEATASLLRSCVS